MKHIPHRRLLFLSSAGMEVCWLFAWANLIMILLTHKLFPLPEAIAVFGLGTALTYVLDGRGWCRLSIIGIHTCSFVLVGLHLIYALSYRSLPFFSTGWLIALFTQPGTALDWLILVLTVFWTLMFWIGGIKLAQRSATYWNVCRRFDAGFSMLLGLLLIKIVLIWNEVSIQDPITGWIIIPFFVFGLLAIGLARNSHQARTTYLAGYGIIGIVLSFAVLILIAGIGLSSLFWPYFVVAADVGYGLLQQGLIPLKPALVGVLTFFWRGSINVESSTETLPVNDTAGGTVTDDHSGTSDLLETILWGGFGSLFILAWLTLAGFAMWHLVGWLLAATPAEKKRARRSSGWLSWLLALPGIMSLCWEWIYRRLRARADATQIYVALLDWGKHSGIPHRQSETPLEYCTRLSKIFSIMQPEIALITDLFQQEIYAELAMDAQQLKQANIVLQRLRNPLHWPARLRSLFRSME